jgi:hypothetical protein
MVKVDKKRSAAMKASWAARKSRASEPVVVDMVNAPPHYAATAIECIDYIKAVLTPEEYRGYLRGACIKYQHRLMIKGEPAENAAKMKWYLERLERAL